MKKLDFVTPVIEVIVMEEDIVVTSGFGFLGGDANCNGILDLFEGFED